MTTNLQGIQATTAAIGTDKDAARHAKLVDAAQGFEGILLQEMLKSMQTGKDEFSGDGDNGDNSGDNLRTFGTEAVAKAISHAGGLGIAKQVIAKVTSETHQRSQASS